MPTIGIPAISPDGGTVLISPLGEFFRSSPTQPMALVTGFRT